MSGEEAAAVDRWYAAHTRSTDGISVEVRFPNEVFLYPIDGTRWCYLRIGGVRFMLKNDELRDFAACVAAQVEIVIAGAS